MLTTWWNSLSVGRGLIVTVALCISLIYVGYTFNSCVLSALQQQSLQNNLPPDLSLAMQGFSENSSPLNLPIGNHNNNFTYNSSINRNYTLGASIWSRVSRSGKYRLLYQKGIRPHRQLPAVLIIGIKKSGTRALLEFIRLHPDVRAAGYEVHFFDRYYKRGLLWYRHHMPYTIEGQITMEKTPSYYITKDVPKRVHKMNPQAKLLVVVRDPVTRAISDYTQAASKKTEMKPFEQLAFVNGSLAVVDTNWGPVKIGVYARYLEKWLKYFPLAQLLFISGERLILDPAYEIGRVQDFMGLKRIVTEKHFYFNATKGFPCLLKSEARAKPHCLGKTKGRNHPHIDSAAIERLREFYRPFNAKFYQMTGINFTWH